MKVNGPHHADAVGVDLEHPPITQATRVSWPRPADSVWMVAGHRAAEVDIDAAGIDVGRGLFLD
jgi:hypothetical protein